MKTTTLLLVILSCLISVQTIAQVTYNKRQGGSLIEAPQESNFTSEASIDKVEYMTGTVKINIPIYTIHVKDITIPISISYSTHGKRVGVESGPIGNGWTLHAGGHIIRHLNGLPDDDYNKGIGYHPLPFSSVDFNNSQCLSFTENMVDGKADGAWDVFTYDLPSGNGQFIKDGTTYPYNPLIGISTFLGGNSHYIFYMKTKDGLLYDFAIGDRKVFKHRKYYTDQNPEWIPISYPNAQWLTDSIEYIASWNIHSIISSRYKDTVLFNYITMTPNTIRTSSTEALPLKRKASLDASGHLSTSSIYDIGYPIISQTRVRTFEHHRLSSIVFPNGRILFIYTGNSIYDKIIDILIQQKTESSYKTIKKFKLANNAPIAAGLTNLFVMDSLNNVISEWKFDYNDDIGTLNDPDNKAQDYWGFYNGATGNNTFLSLDSNLFLLANKHSPIYLKGTQENFRFPVKRKEELLYYGLVSEANIDNIDPYRPDSYINFADRQFHFDAAVMGTLKSITLPTGATVNYEYEPNKFYQILNPVWGQPDSKIMEGGGIRIKSITTRDANGNLIVRKEYRYGQGDPGKTQLWETGYGYIKRPGNILAVNNVYMTGGATDVVQSLLLLSHPVNDMVLYDGSYVVYETVGEYICGDTTCNGGSIYFYSFGAPQDAWGANNPYLSSSLYLPTFYVNSGIKNHSLSGIPIKKLILTYNKHYDQFYQVKDIHNHLKKFQNPNQGIKSFFAGIQATLSAQQGVIGTFCNFSPGAHTDLECYDIYGIPGMDDDALNNYIGDSYNNADNPYFDGKYGYSLGNFHYNSFCYRIDTTTVIDGDYPTMTNKTIYSYENPDHLLPTKVMTVNSEKDTLIKHIRYAKDFPAIGGDTPVSSIPSDLIEKISTIKQPGGSEVVTSAELVTYKTIGGHSSVYKKYTYNSGGTLLPFSSFTLFDGNATRDQHYELRTDNEIYDMYGDLLQFTTDGRQNTILWGYNRQYPIAVVKNAAFNDIAYTSFEGTHSGGWLFPSGGTTSNDFSGANVYNLTNAGTIGITKDVDPGKKYIVSYYSTSGAPYTVTGTQGTPTKMDMPSWHYYQHLITGVSTVKIAGNGYIDELRLYPVNAQMTTYTYDPLKGITSKCDPSGKLLHYGYDNANRLNKVWDDYINLLKMIQYKYQAPVNNNIF